MEERGIVYLSRIPPYMGKTKLRRIFSKHGDIDRTYFTLEPRINRVRRIKDGGTKKKCFTEGWIEFLRKQDAKRVAALYNNAPTGGKKRHNFYREDLWCIRYLPKFTWTHLEHKIEMDKHVAESEVRNEVTLARKANKFHTKQVNKARYLEKRQKLEEHPQYSYIQKTPIPEQD